jgi:hypothetical protein
VSNAFAHLPPADQKRAEELAERFRVAGAAEPEQWAASEVEEDIPQLARLLLLRSVWRSAEQWKQPPEAWFAEVEPDAEQPAAEEDDDEPTLVPAGESHGPDGEPPFLAAQQAVQRILAAGANPDDLKEVARAIFLHTAFDAVHTVDAGYDPEAGEGMPGWLLMEVGSDLVLTGRPLGALHEDLLTTEPDDEADEQDEV